MKNLSCICCIAAALLMAVATPAYSNGSKCGFDPSGTTGVSFGNLDPSVAAPVTASATVMVGDCNTGAPMVVAVDQGQRGNRTMRRQNGTELIPYSVTTPSFFPSDSSAPGNFNYKPASFAATVQASAYQDAVAGIYSDLLIVTVTP